MKIIALTALLLLSSCSYDNLAYKYGNGIKDAINGAAMGLACVAVSPTICASAAGVSGYIKGKQDARVKIVAKDNAKLIKRLAEAKAEDMGVKVDTCWFWCD